MEKWKHFHTQRSPSAFYCLCYEIFWDGKRCVIADIITFDSAPKENRLNIFHVEGNPNRTWRFWSSDIKFLMSAEWNKFLLIAKLHYRHYTEGFTLCRVFCNVLIIFWIREQFPQHKRKFSIFISVCSVAIHFMLSTRNKIISRYSSHLKVVNSVARIRLV